VEILAETESRGFGLWESMCLLKDTLAGGSNSHDSFHRGRETRLKKWREGRELSIPAVPFLRET